jgi:uncharacterized protein (TIGR02246 family)
MNRAIGRNAVAPAPRLLALLFVVVSGCTSETIPMDSAKLNDFGARYTAAWCSHDAEKVASFFSAKASLTVNNGKPVVGRVAIAEYAQTFMTGFPNLVVSMDKIAVDGAKAMYYWTLTGSNTGPGGTGRFVQLSGMQEWRFGPDGLIVEALGHFDTANFQRQLMSGAKGS